jgi:hypothetical protein
MTFTCIPYLFAGLQEREGPGQSGRSAEKRGRETERDTCRTGGKGDQGETWQKREGSRKRERRPADTSADIEKTIEQREQVGSAP